MLIPIFLREKNWGHADNNKLHPSNIFFVFVAYKLGYILDLNRKRLTFR